LTVGRTAEGLGRMAAVRAKQRTPTEVCTGSFRCRWAPLGSGP
jgi:hypothetical protein